jgi:hypothetical protein
MPVAKQENHEKLILDGQSLVQDLNQGPVANPDSKCYIMYHSARSDLQIRICHCQVILNMTQKSRPFYHHVQSQTVEMSAKNNCLLWRLRFLGGETGRNGVWFLEDCDSCYKTGEIDRCSPRTQDHIVW